jgi:hypothetical protein
MKTRRNRLSQIGNSLPSEQNQILPQAGTVKRGFEDLGYKSYDLTQLVYCLAVFDPKDSQIYKVTAIDYRGQRYELSGEKISRFLSMRDGVLFVYTNEKEFIHFYAQYKTAREAAGERVKKPHHIFDWLAQDASRLGPTIEQQRKIDDEDKR